MTAAADRRKIRKLEEDLEEAEKEKKKFERERNRFEKDLKELQVCCGIKRSILSLTCWL
jgi:hypothetical protein